MFVNAALFLLFPKKRLTLLLMLGNRLDRCSNTIVESTPVIIGVCCADVYGALMFGGKISMLYWFGFTLYCGKKISKKIFHMSWEKCIYKRKTSTNP